MATENRSALQNQDLNIPKIKLTSDIKDVNGTIEQDVHFFRGLIAEEEKALKSFCSEWSNFKTDKGMKAEDSDQIQGDIRTVIGQAQLVMNERFTQFEGLVNNCEFKTSEKPVTWQDLQGFWEMIYFQVKDVKEKFENLNKRKSNDWTVEEIIPKNEGKEQKIIRKKSVKGRSKSTSNCKREEARKRLASVKAAMKKEALPVVSFDAGFFKISSPVRNVVKRATMPLTPSSTDRKRKIITPRSDNFLHGRLLKVRKEGETSEVKKLLSFGSTEETDTHCDENKKT